MPASFARLSFALALVCAFVALPGCRTSAEPETSAASASFSAAAAPKNVILFISDGCGPASFTLAREYRRFLGEKRGLAIDAIQKGSVHTYSTTSRVTDSAAGATAYACGVKTFNGAIAVDTLERPIATLLEGAESLGKATGLVTTTRITHATPASFSAHVADRGSENDIALQQLAQDIEVLFGGGRRHFLPSTDEDSGREDARNLLEEARSAGYSVIGSRDELLGASEVPVLGLFASSDLPFEIDRDEDESPSLAEMTRAAIELLDDDPDGFFLMVEGGRIDHAAHGNDVAAHVHDILAYDAAVEEALRFARENGATLIVATSDHETGGLTLGRNVRGSAVYAWHPEVIHRVKGSHGAMEDRIEDGLSDPRQILREVAGITDPTDGELALFEGAESADRLVDAVAEVIDRRAVIGWTSGGHTAVDVNLYAFGPGSDRFIGHHDNTFVGRTIAELMRVDLDALSRTLQAETTAR
ncbi:MAG TPA: alkaline phosphatase [Rhodothermales bacterium]